MFWASEKSNLEWYRNHWKKASRSCVWNHAFWPPGQAEMHDCRRWDVNLCLRCGNNRSIKRISCHRRPKTKKIVTKVAQKSRSCWQFSSIIVVLCITNSFHLAKPSTRNIIWLLCVICVKLFAKRGQNYGETTVGFCTTIMRHLTLHWFFVSFSPKMQSISFRNHPIRLIWLRVTSGYLVNSKDHSTTPFWVDWGD